MYNMHRKIAAKEKIVGFYSTGPKIRQCDIDIELLFRKYTPHPVMTIIDVRPDTEGLPTQAYHVVETVVEGKENVRTFEHISCEVGAHEAEEVKISDKHFLFVGVACVCDARVSITDV
jgi:26S proteasome regulatory subunit N8